MNRMIYIVNARIPTEKAHGYQIMKMCECFTTAGTDVTLCLPKRKTGINANPFDYYQIKENFTINKFWTIDLINRIPFRKFAFYLQYVTFALSAMPYLLRSDSKTIYTRDEICALLAALIRKEVFFEKHGKSPTDKFFVKWLGRLGAKFIGITEYYRKYLVDEFNINQDNIMIAHDGVDLEKYENVVNDKNILRSEFNLPIDKKLLLYVGQLKTLGKEKGVDWIIKALVNIKKDFPDLVFVSVGGKKEEIDGYLKMAKDHGIDDRVLFIENVSRTLVPKYLKAADFLVLPYPRSEHYLYFMSPLKLFEYMAAGRAILSTDLPSIREVLDDDEAVFFEADSESSFSDAVKKVMSIPFAQRLGELTKAKVKEYTWEKRAKNILDFIFY